MRPQPLALLTVVLLLMAASPAPAQGVHTPQSVASAIANSVVPPKQEETLDDDSPRASLTAYLKACHRGDYNEAAEYLELLPDEVPRGPELARRLKAVLDRHLWFDLDTISGESGGNRADGAPNADEIGKIADAQGKPQHIRLVRRKRPEGDRWVFAHSTVQNVDAWFSDLPNRWMLDNLPPSLLRPGPRLVLRWQWMALPVLALVSLSLGLAISRLLIPFMRWITSKTTHSWDDALVARLGGPLTLATGAFISYVALPLLGLYPAAEDFVTGMLRTSFFVAFFWSLLRSVDVISDGIKLSPWGLAHLSSRTLISLAARMTKVALGAVAIVAIVSQLGYPVTSLIAGLGIGGLAFALASQKTVENLFGAFSLSVDQPFREGDYVNVEGFSGWVESIGLRSTRVRTAERTVITIPNGKLAEMRIESLAVRDRCYLGCTLGLVHGTTALQMRTVVAGLEQVLRAHPKLLTDNLVVRFKELTQSSLDIQIQAWFLTADYAEFQLIRQDTLLAFMEVVEKAGTSFAFPTRTVHLVGQKP